MPTASAAAPIAAKAAGPTLPAATLSNGTLTATPTFNTTPAEVDAAEKSGFSPVSPAATVSPTVLSDSNIRDNVIPDLNSKSSTLTPTPTTLAPAPANGDASGSSGGTSDGSGSSNQYGVDPSNLDYNSIYDKVFGSVNSQPQDDETANSLNTLKALGTSNDAAFSNQVATIYGQYDTLTKALTSAQTNSSDKETNFLLAGKGGNAFRTSTGNSIMQSLHNGQISALADLQTKENNAIAKVKDAQAKSDFATMQKEMQVLDKMQTEKKSLANKISTQLLAANQKIAASKLKVTKDNAIADALTSGKTAPLDIMKAVNTDENGGDTGLNVTLSDVNSVLNDISNGDTKGLTGAVGEYYSMKAAGTLPSSIKSLPEGEQLKSFIELEKASTSKTASASKPLYTTVKGTPVTKTDIEAGVEKLDSAKGDDGYADPKVYEAMYKYWEDQGLPPEDFLKNYPPKYYIDPTDTSLPAYLRPTATKASVSAVNPFGPPSTSISSTSPASGSFSP